MQSPVSTSGTATRRRSIGLAPPSVSVPQPVTRRSAPTGPSSVASVASGVPAASLVSSQTATSLSKVLLFQRRVDGDARHVAAVAGAVEPPRPGQHLHLRRGDEVAAMGGGDDHVRPHQRAAAELRRGVVRLRRHEQRDLERVVGGRRPRCRRRCAGWTRLDDLLRSTRSAPPSRSRAGSAPRPGRSRSRASSSAGPPAALRPGSRGLRRRQGTATKALATLRWYIISGSPWTADTNHIGPVRRPPRTSAQIGLDREYSVRTSRHD